MMKLKVFFILGVVVSVLVFCAFAPGVCIERFMLPEGACVSCSATNTDCGHVLAEQKVQPCACR